MPFELLQITAAYSNAVLIAIMPHVADCAKKLNLPTPQPITQSQVERFVCFPRTDHVGGRLILTNGCEFIFDHGRVQNFTSPQSYYYLQKTELVPKFYGPVTITEPQALSIAQQALKKLGYSDEMISTGKAPKIDPPPHDGSHIISRYHIRWFDTTRGHDPQNHPLSAEFEIAADTGRIEMMNIFNQKTYQPDLKLNVKPTLLQNEAESKPVGIGRKIFPVSEAYSNALVMAVLPKCSGFAMVLGYPLKEPIKKSDLDASQCICGLVDNDPMVVLGLKNGARFNFRHGQVIAFYAPNVMILPGRTPPNTFPENEQFRARFYGAINMTTDDAVALTRQNMRNLGYSEKVLQIEGMPRISGPSWWGTNRIARCSVEWRNTIDSPTLVSAEVDMTKKILTSLYINDHANTNIWRKAPEMSAKP